MSQGFPADDQDYIFGILESIRLLAPNEIVWHIQVRQSLKGQNHELIDCYMEEPEALTLLERVPLGTPIQMLKKEKSSSTIGPWVHNFYAFF